MSTTRQATFPVAAGPVFRDIGRTTATATPDRHAQRLAAELRRQAEAAMDRAQVARYQAQVAAYEVAQYHTYVACNQAWAARDQAWAAWNHARAAWDQAYAAVHQARAIESDADKARDNVLRFAKFMWHQCEQRLPELS